MTVNPTLVRGLFSALALGASATLIHAESGVLVWQHPKPIATFADAEHVGASEMVVTQCRPCKRTVIVDQKRGGPSGHGAPQWFAVGAQHDCPECKGVITIVEGKPAGALQMDCSKCGTGSVACSIMPVEERTMEPKTP